MSAHASKGDGFSVAQQAAGTFVLCLIAFVVFSTIARSHVKERHAKSLENARASTLQAAALDGEIALAYFTGEDADANTLVTLADSHH